MRQERLTPTIAAVQEMLVGRHSRVGTEASAAAAGSKTASRRNASRSNAVENARQAAISEEPGGRDPRPYAIGADNDNRLTGTRG